MRISNDGKSIFISDEYGPHVYQFDRATGRRIKSFVLPDYYAVDTLSPSGSSNFHVFAVDTSDLPTFQPQK